jgi:predicted outer membrane repeat protein
MKSLAPVLRSVRSCSFLLALAAFAARADATTWFVKESAAAGGNGTTWGRAWTSLDTALAAATDGDRIWVAEGTYRPSNPAAGFVITKSVSLYGGFEGDEADIALRQGAFDQTILEGDLGAGARAAHVVSIDLAGWVVIDGFQVRNGGDLSTTEKGGGIQVRCSDLLLSNSLLASNRAQQGGAIHIKGGCVDGGSGSGGPGPENLIHQLHVTRTIFQDNECALSGGAIHAQLSQGSIWNSTFLRNRADKGGAVYLAHMMTSQEYLIVNSIFHANGAVGGGGALYLGAFEVVTGGHATLLHCTLAHNRSSLGGAVATSTAMQGPSAASCTIRNSIVWGNRAPVGPQLAGFVAAMFTIVEIEGGGTWPGYNNLNEDPRFVDEEAGRLQLLPGSRAIDAGNSYVLVPDSFDLDEDGDFFEVIDVDHNGLPRTFDDPDVANTGTPYPITYVDLGAFEHQ